MFNEYIRVLVTGGAMDFMKCGNLLIFMKKRFQVSPTCMHCKAVIEEDAL